MTIYDMVKSDPKFKRYCARKTTQKIKPKRFRVPIPRAIGALSVLGEYPTGRVLRVTQKNENGEYSYTRDEVARLTKRAGEFVSVLPEIIGEIEALHSDFGDSPFDAGRGCDLTKLNEIKSAIDTVDHLLDLCDAIEEIETKLTRLSA
jgi:hypothetical protein